jgi:hypothetical protein
VNPSRIGVSSAGKRAIAAVLIVLILGGVYLATSFSKGGVTVSTTSFLAASSATPIANQTGMYSLLKPFPQMTVSVDFYDEPDGLTENSTFSYAVIGTASLNSSEYTKVQFTTVGVGDDMIAWFNSSGDVNRVDVLGQKNYTGAGAYVLASAYTSAFGVIPVISNNATLLSLLNVTSLSTTSIGPTKADVTSYSLPAETATYASINARYAVIPGADLKLAVYLDENLRNRSTTLIQVTSITQ